MATTYKDCVRAVEREKRRSLGTNLQRPLTGYEQQIVYGLYSFATFVDLGKGVMQKRNAHIKRAAARMGLIKWACMSLFTDYMSQLTPEAQDTFARRLSCPLLRARWRTGTTAGRCARTRILKSLPVLHGRALASIAH